MTIDRKPIIGKKLVGKITDFIEFVMLPNKESAFPFQETRISFSYTEFGGLILSGQEAQMYRTVLQDFQQLLSKNDHISPKALEKYFQIAILKALDIPNERPLISQQKRIEDAIADLERKLSSSPNEYKLYIQVEGLSTNGLPFTFGEVEFCEFGETECNEFNYRNSLVKKPLSDINDYLSTIMGKVVAVLKVRALDNDAARSKALKVLKVTIDVINFFSDMIPNSKGFAFLPGDAQSNTGGMLSLYNDYGFVLHYSGISGIITPLSFCSLLQLDSERHLGFGLASKLLVEHSGELKERLLTAIQWAGQATAIKGKRKEEAYLLFAIALESLILVDQDPIELNYRLRLRVAHLLGKGFQGRTKIFTEIGELYRIRSSIVHNGYFEVTDADLNAIRFITKTAIVAILSEEPFTNMKTKNDLVEWFNNKILSSTEDQVPYA